MRGFTTFTVLANIGYCVTNALIPTLGQGNRLASLFYGYVGFAFLMPGMNANHGSALKGWSTTLAQRNGFASGEYAGYFSNLRAITVTLSPLIYGRIYSSITAGNNAGTTRLSPGIAWIVAAVLGCVIPELIWRSIPSEELEEKKK